MYKVGVGIGAALATGVVMGLVSRALMRGVSVAAGDPSSFSWGGTLGIVVAYIVFLLPGALLAAFVTRRWRSALLAVGAVLLCVVATGIAREDLGSTYGFTLLNWVGVGVSTIGIYATILAAPALVLRTIDRRLARRAPRPTPEVLPALAST